MGEHPTDSQDRTGFFVAPDECSWCGCCHCEAPRNFSWDEESKNSIVHKQPKTREEKTDVISAFSVCAMDSIYYGGRDVKVIGLLLEQGVQPFSIVHYEDYKPRKRFLGLF